MTRPVDVVIAVHTTTRPVGRAVRSVLEGNAGPSRLTVVCHNIAASEISAGVAPEHRASVRFLEHHDGRTGPAGPFNAGMAAAEGEFVSIMGSDDRLEPGAVESWLRVARRTGAETVVTRLALGEARRPVRTPPVRPWLRGVADPLRDRLSYRSAPLGLVSTEARRRLGLELVEDVVVGDDVPYVTRLWFETRVAVDRRGPAYVIGEDAGDRVTYTARPIHDELAFVRHMLAAGWFRGYPLESRRAVAAKATRIHLFGAVHNRRDPAFWVPGERSALAEVAHALLDAAPRFERVLSRADRDLLDAAATGAGTAEELVAMSLRRRRHGLPATVLTRDLAAMGRREAPPRLMVASALVR